MGLFDRFKKPQTESDELKKGEEQINAGDQMTAEQVNEQKLAQAERLTSQIVEEAEQEGRNTEKIIELAGDGQDTSFLKRLKDTYEVTNHRFENFTSRTAGHLERAEDKIAKNWSGRSLLAVGKIATIPLQFASDLLMVGIKSVKNKLKADELTELLSGQAGPEKLFEAMGMDRRSDEAQVIKELLRNEQTKDLALDCIAKSLGRSSQIALNQKSKFTNYMSLGNGETPKDGQEARTRLEIIYLKNNINPQDYQACKDFEDKLQQSDPEKYKELKGLAALTEEASKKDQSSKVGPWNFSNQSTSLMQKANIALNSAKNGMLWHLLKDPREIASLATCTINGEYIHNLASFDLEETLKSSKTQDALMRDLLLLQKKDLFELPMQEQIEASMRVSGDRMTLLKNQASAGGFALKNYGQKQLSTMAYLAMRAKTGIVMDIFKYNTGKHKESILAAEVGNSGLAEEYGRLMAGLEKNTETGNPAEQQKKSMDTVNEFGYRLMNLDHGGAAIAVKELVDKMLVKNAKGGGQVTAEEVAFLEKMSGFMEYQMSKGRVDIGQVNQVKQIVDRYKMESRSVESLGQSKLAALKAAGYQVDGYACKRTGNWVKDFFVRDEKHAAFVKKNSGNLIFDYIGYQADKLASLGSHQGVEFGGAIALEHYMLENIGSATSALMSEIPMVGEKMGDAYSMAKAMTETAGKVMTFDFLTGESLGKTQTADKNAVPTTNQLEALKTFGLGESNLLKNVGEAVSGVEIVKQINDAREKNEQMTQAMVKEVGQFVQDNKVPLLVAAMASGGAMTFLKNPNLLKNLGKAGFESIQGSGMLKLANSNLFRLATAGVAGVGVFSAAEKTTAQSQWDVLDGVKKPVDVKNKFSEGSMAGLFAQTNSALAAAEHALDLKEKVNGARSSQVENVTGKTTIEVSKKTQVGEVAPKVTEKISLQSIDVKAMSSADNWNAEMFERLYQLDKSHASLEINSVRASAIFQELNEAIQNKDLARLQIARQSLSDFKAETDGVYGQNNPYVLAGISKIVNANIKVLESAPIVTIKTELTQTRGEVKAEVKVEAKAVKTEVGAEVRAKEAVLAPLHIKVSNYWNQAMAQKLIDGGKDRDIMKWWNEEFTANVNKLNGALMQKDVTNIGLQIQKINEFQGRVTKEYGAESPYNFNKIKQDVDVYVKAVLAEQALPTNKTEVGTTTIKAGVSVKEGTSSGATEKIAPGTVQTKTEQSAVNADSYKVSVNFEVVLGKDGVPAELERVFTELAVNNLVLNSDKAGAENARFTQKDGARALNMAANMVKLTEGKTVGGVSAKSFAEACKYDKKTGKLEVLDKDKFNQYVEQLEAHADKLWDEGKLQSKGGAVSYLGNIKDATWLKIINGDGLNGGFATDGKEDGQQFGVIEGHANIDQSDIDKFKKVEHRIVNKEVTREEVKVEKTTLSPQALEKKVEGTSSTTGKAAAHVGGSETNGSLATPVAGKILETKVNNAPAENLSDVERQFRGLGIDIAILPEKDQVKVLTEYGKVFEQIKEYDQKVGLMKVLHNPKDRVALEKLTHWDKLGKDNLDYKDIRAKYKRNGDLEITFVTKDFVLNTDLVITKNGKVYVDGMGSNDLGNEKEPEVLNDKSLKMALKFVYEKSVGKNRTVDSKEFDASGVVEGAAKEPLTEVKASEVKGNKIETTEMKKIKFDAETGNALGKLSKEQISAYLTSNGLSIGQKETRNLEDIIDKHKKHNSLTGQERQSADSISGLINNNLMHLESSNETVRRESREVIQKVLSGEEYREHKVI